MTSVLPPPADAELPPGDAEAAAPAIVLTRPGFFERLYVVILAFLLLYSLPNEWLAGAPLPGQRNYSVNESQGSLPTVVFVTLFVICILLLTSNWHLVWKLVKGEPLLTIFVLLAPISVLWSVDPDVTIRRSVAYTLTTLFAYYLVVRFELLDILRLTGVAMMFGTFANLVFIQVLPQFGRTPTRAEFGINSGSWTGVFVTKNALGLNTVLTIVVFLILARADKKRRIIYYPFALLNFYIVVFSDSKTSYANAVLLSGMLVLYLVFRSRKQLFGAVAFAMASGVVVATAFVTANLAFIAGRLERDVTLSGRTPLWTDVITAIKEKPILGSGWSSFWNGWGSPAHEIWIEHAWAPPHAHNALLDYALQLGVVGAGVFIALFVRSVIRATRHIRDTKGPLGLMPLIILSLTLLASITESGVIGRNHAWVLFVVAVLVVTRDSRRVDSILSVRRESAARPTRTLRVAPRFD